MTLRRVLLAAVFVAALVACGDDEDAVETDESSQSQPSDAGRISIMLAFDQPPTDDEVDATTAVIERRLDELGVEGAPTVERSGDQLTVRYEPSDAFHPGDVADVLGAGGQLAFRPVLSTVPPDVAPACEGPDGPLTPEFDEEGQHVLCYELGPAGLTGEGVLTASAEESDMESLVVALELHPGEAGLAPFNELAAVCFDRTPACPTGQVAIVFDDQVVSAPTIQQPAFDERGVSISGDFTESEAEALAVVLRSGALTVGLRVEEIRSSG